MTHLLRLFHTVRHLRAKQIIYRLYYRCRLLSAPLLQKQVQPRSWKKYWHSPQWQNAGILKDVSNREGQAYRRFFFLNESGTVGSISDWNNPAKSKLWLYNLHYLDVLNSQGAGNRIDVFNHLIDDWINHNPALEGNGWEPYTLSLRLVNLVKWQMRHHYDGSKLLNSIQQQTAALSKQVEYHIMGNHLFTNGKALVFAGAALAGGDDFLRQGLGILDKEIPEQFLEDGGSFELSPMYHAILLWDLCDLLNLAKSSALPELKCRMANWEEVIRRGLLWLSHMCHPDGDIAFFNDSTLGIAPRYIDVCQYTSTLGIQASVPNNSCLSVAYLSNSGYVSIAPDLTTKLIIDVGNVGPTYQPGHAHADTLSFELSVFGQRLFVNSGISQYGVDNKRRYQRSTQAHNTVVIDNKNSSDVWGGFRVGRRAKPQKFQLTQTHEQVMVNCLHDGYHSLFNPLTHSRQCQVTSQSCQIVDSVTGSYQKAEARYYLHPEITIEQLSSAGFECRLPSGKSVSVTFIGNADIRIENTQWYPGFGIQQENHCLIATFAQQPLRMDITW